MQAPTSEWFADQARQVIGRLPSGILEHVSNLVVDVDTEPDEKTLLDAGFTWDEIKQGETLFGLYEPIFQVSDLNDDGPSHQSPMRIRIFSSAIVDACDTIEEVRHEVWMTVIHELAHHFGWSERDLENFEGGLEVPNGIFQTRHPDAD